MQNTSTAVTNEEKAIEKPEREGVHREEIHRRNHFPMVLERGLPPSDLVGILRGPLYPARNRSLRDIETKHLQFPVDAWRSPRRVFCDHFEDEVAKLFADSLPSEDNSVARQPGPIELKASAVPPNNSLWAHHDQGLFPLAPELLRNNPEEFIKPGKAWTGMHSLQDDELLPECQIFEPKAPTRTEKAENRDQKELNFV